MNTLTVASEKIDFAPVVADLSRAERKARQLADWTGIPLPRALDITGLAYGGFDWASFVDNPVFVPDEAANLHRSYEDRDVQRRSWVAHCDTEKRLDRVHHRLMHELRVGPAMAMFLMKMWQPAAKHAKKRPAWEYSFGSRRKIFEVIHVFDSVPGVPDDWVLVLCESWSSLDLSLRLVQKNRLVRYLDEDEAPAVTEPMMGKALLSVWRSDGQWSRFAFLHNGMVLEEQVRKGGALRLDTIVPTLKKCLNPPKLAASWLTHPMDTERTLRMGAENFPWRAEDHKGLREFEETSPFWCIHLPEFSLEAAFTPNGVFYGAYVPGSNHQLQGCVSPAYTTTLTHLNITRLDWPGEDSKQGWHFVQFAAENDVRGGPLPGLTKELAKSASQRAGMIDFYNSEAGLACAKWALTHPDKHLAYCVATAKSNNDPEQRTPAHGMSLACSQRRTYAKRFEFELAQAFVI